MTATLDEHRRLIEGYLAVLPFASELGPLSEAMRYSLEGGGKRIRPLLCLSVGEATGSAAEDLLPAAAAVELVHTFGMVHDDLPALDDDDERRGRATSHVQFDEATAILNGDALLAQAFDLALSYSNPSVARELAHAALGMIGGQHEDISGTGEELVRMHSLKTGRLFEAAVGCALAVSEVPDLEQQPWRSFASEFGLLYQIVDDVLDEDGLTEQLGGDGARELAEKTEARARALLDEIVADTALLDELVSGLKRRAAAS
jgi:geranylgeranyl diphosphate synthase, type II